MARERPRASTRRCAPCCAVAEQSLSLGRYEIRCFAVAERTRAALAGYRGGGAPLSAVLEARRMEIDMRLERVRLEMENAGLWAQLEYLIPPGSVYRGASK